MKTGGHLTLAARASLVANAFPALVEGFRLGAEAQKDDRRNAPLQIFEPPDTAMVRSTREYLDKHSKVSMVKHCFRTAFWTLMVLNQHVEVDPKMIETAWVAALLHDIGLEVHTTNGDFSMGSIEVLQTIALENHWPDDQLHEASEAIAINLSTRVDPKRSGVIAWAMNVGGIGEVGFPPHRAQMSSKRMAELEARYPRDGFRETSMRLIREEAQRIPDGRFAFLGWVFPLIMQ